jgi:hypothetical protein
LREIKVSILLARNEGEISLHVTCVPNLVVIILVTVATPNLNFVSSRQTAATQIDTSALGPFDTDDRI